MYGKRKEVHKMFNAWAKNRIGMATSAPLELINAIYDFIVGNKKR